MRGRQGCEKAAAAAADRGSRARIRGSVRVCEAEG